MTIGIMQPYIFPYIGYFQLINAVDKFIVYDDVAYINKGWINRNNILVGGKASLFTLPLVNASQNRLIKDIEIDNLPAWAKKFLRTIEQSYKKAPFYNETLEILAEVFQSEPANIAELCTKGLKTTCIYLGIETQFVDSSAVYNNHHLKAQERILDICKQENADHYINPSGGMAIYDKQLFADNKILLNFIKSKPVQYNQFKNEFVPWLSMIDILMFCSADAIQQHLKEFELV